jgi:N utilization substance protein B
MSDCLADQVERRQPAAESERFATQLSEKLISHEQEIQEWLAMLVENWDPSRLGIVEKVILLMALTELRYSPEVPWRVVINEACELARRFCDEEAVAFVNGVLDRAAAEVRERKRPADPGSEEQNR